MLEWQGCSFINAFTTAKPYLRQAFMSSFLIDLQLYFIIHCQLKVVINHMDMIDAIGLN